MSTENQSSITNFEQNIELSDNQKAALAQEEGLEEQVETKVEAEEPEDKKAYLHVPVSLPATITCREDLDKVMEQHHIWLESVLNPSKKIGAGRANLKDADLSGWDLTGINLSGATLKNTKLIGAILCKANLTAADLSNADLQGANLQGAKLKRAILTHADFRDADLEGADLAHARTDFTKFTHQDTAAATEEKQEELELSELTSNGETEDQGDLTLA